MKLYVEKGSTVMMEGKPYTEGDEIDVKDQKVADGLVKGGSCYTEQEKKNREKRAAAQAEKK